jgi:hypothetical protein
MRHSMERVHGVHHRGKCAAAVDDSKPPGSMWLRRIAEGPAAPGVARTDVVCGHNGATEVYDAVDLRLMDTFPASDPVGRY